MKDTSGNQMFRYIPCDCGITGGCEKCRPVQQIYDGIIKNIKTYQEIRDEKIKDDDIKNLHKATFKTNL